MVIEADARRFITEAIEAEEKLSEIEKTLGQINCKIELNESYNQARQEFIQKLANINAVVNINGTGRDDLTDLGILTAAEKIPDRLLIGQCNSIQVLAEKII